MPPRNSKVEGLVAMASAPSSWFQDEKFIEQLFHFFAEKDDTSLLALTAMALGAEDYLIDLKQQIIVDTRLDFLRFCWGQNYTPLKILHLIKWMEHFQQVIVESGGDVDRMRQEMTTFVAAEIEEGWRWRQAAQSAEDGAAEQPPPAASKTAGKKGARAAEKVAVEETEVAAALPRENIYLAKEDVGPFCTYLLRGVIQHASLHVHVATRPRVMGTAAEFCFFLERPVPAPPLRRAVALEKTQQDLSLTVPPVPSPSSSFSPAGVCKVWEQREAELADLVGQYEEAVAREALWRRTRQVEEEMKLLIENKGTKKAVEDTYDGLEAQLAQRQMRILQRIVALEKTLGLEPPL